MQIYHQLYRETVYLTLKIGFCISFGTIDDDGKTLLKRRTQF